MVSFRVGVRVRVWVEVRVQSVSLYSATPTFKNHLDFCLKITTPHENDALHSPQVYYQPLSSVGMIIWQSTIIWCDTCTDLSGRQTPMPPDVVHTGTPDLWSSGVTDRPGNASRTVQTLVVTGHDDICHFLLK